MTTIGGDMLVMFRPSRHPFYGNRLAHPDFAALHRIVLSFTEPTVGHARRRLRGVVTVRHPDLRFRRVSRASPPAAPDYGRGTTVTSLLRRCGKIAADRRLSERQGRLARRGWQASPSKYRPGRIVSPSAPTCPRRARADIREARTAAVGPFRYHPPTGATGTVEVAGSRSEHPPSEARGRTRAEPRITVERPSLRHSRWHPWPAGR